MRRRFSKYLKQKLHWRRSRGGNPFVIGQLLAEEDFLEGKTLKQSKKYFDIIYSKEIE